MTTTIAHDIAAQYRAIPIDLIHPSPTNPRKTFGGIDELAEDLKIRGMLLPLIVRPHGKEFECVAGERRLRAAKLAKLKEVPALVRELSDLEVLEIQIVENAKRADIHPVEEAEAYRALRDVHKLSVEEIAAKVGRPKGTVYERLKLTELAPEVRKAALAGELPASHAVLIARIPDKKLQVEALKQIAGDGDDEAISYRDALALVHGSFMLRLSEAPFDITDAQLVPKAGPCTVCPKRTGNQRELFADVKSPDICTDPTCHTSKVDALWALKVKQAEQAGQKALSAADTKKVFPYDHTDTPNYGSPFRALSETEWVGNQQKTVKQLLGKEAPPTILARAPSGKIVELVPRDIVEKKMRAAEREVRPTSTTVSRNDAESVQQKKYKLRTKVVAVAMPKLVEKVEKSEALVWRFIAESFFDGGYSDSLREVAKRRGLKRDGAAANKEAMLAALAKMNEGQLRAFCVEVIVSAFASGGGYSLSYSETFSEACRMFGVDLKKIEEEVKAEGGNKPAKPAAKPEPKAAKPKKGKKK